MKRRTVQITQGDTRVEFLVGKSYRSRQTNLYTHKIQTGKEYPLHGIDERDDGLFLNITNDEGDNVWVPGAFLFLSEQENPQL